MSRKPLEVTVMPFPVQRTVAVSPMTGIFVFTSHVRFMICHSVSLGEVYVSSEPPSSPQNRKPLSGMLFPYSRPMTSRCVSDGSP